MYQRRRVAFCPLPGPALSSIFNGFICVDECVIAKSDMGESHIPSDECVLRHTISGQAHMIFDTGDYAVDPAGIDVYGAGCTYRQIVGRRPWATRYLILRGPWAAPVLNLITAGTTPVLRYESTHAHLARTIDETVALALDQAPGWDWRCAARIAAIIDAVLNPAPAISYAAALPIRIGALLDARPDHSYSSVAIARALNLPLSTLTHRFRAEAGLPLARWMRERRLQRARLLLRQGLNVVEVAARMGFSSPFQLSRAYKAWAGHAPSSDIIRAPCMPTHAGHHGR
jgi:AraC-like DNA-binding protein